MKIWYSTYQLFPKSVLNSKIKIKYRQGALLRVRFDDDRVGYADLCPFSELGDQPLELELKNLLISKPSQLTSRSLLYARLDAEARFEKRSLFDPKIRIKNHFLVNDLLNFDLNRIATLQADGYSEFKIKIGREINVETQKLRDLCDVLAKNSRLRLDFNMSFNQDRFVHWFDKNQSWLRSHLEFVEDPFAYSAKEWREVSDRWNIVLALDFASTAEKCKAEGAQIVVIKPVVDDVDKILLSLKNTRKKVVFTHYMDFPLGQMSALVTAQKAQAQFGDMVITCGLQHHDIYDGFSFQSEIKHDGPYILPPEGLGLGFDVSLEKQKWVELQ